MPRGVYDRSKLKKTKVESTGTVKKVKVKTVSAKAPVGDASSQPESFHALHMMHEARQNLKTLSELPLNPFTQAQIDENLRQLDKYTKEVFGTQDAAKEVVPVEQPKVVTSSSTDKVVPLPRVVPPPPLPVS